MRRSNECYNFPKRFALALCQAFKIRSKHNNITSVFEILGPTNMSSCQVSLAYRGVVDMMVIYIITLMRI